MQKQDVSAMTNGVCLPNLCLLYISLHCCFHIEVSVMVYVPILYKGKNTLNKPKTRTGQLIWLNYNNSPS
jgi:hypothetical protein